MPLFKYKVKILILTGKVCFPARIYKDVSEAFANKEGKLKPFKAFIGLKEQLENEKQIKCC